MGEGADLEADPVLPGDMGEPAQEDGAGGIQLFDAVELQPTGVGAGQGQVGPDQSLGTGYRIQVEGAAEV